MINTIEQETVLSPQAKKWGMLCHLSAYAMFVIPFGNIILPLIIWFLKKDISPFVEEQGVNSLNFQITMSIATFISVALCWILIGYVLLLFFSLFNVVQIAIASYKSNKGKSYKYPFTIYFIV